jgi:hypothetical protein
MDKILIESSCSVLSYREGQASLDRSVGRIFHEEEKAPVIHLWASF